ncbi:MAG: class I SAM-dependent methyltransferase [Planctomycetaceae bacterium]
MDFHSSQTQAGTAPIAPEICDDMRKNKSVAGTDVPQTTNNQTVSDSSPTANEWDNHWKRQRTSIFGSLCTFYRRHFRARSVAYYFDRYFPTTGVFAECGSGSSETSCRIRLHQRKLIAIDFSEEALSRAARMPQISVCIRADIRNLPFADNSLDGIWNLGVMEHFEEDDQLLILREFHRVVKPGGSVLLWWPPTAALDFLVLSPFGWQFPGEPGRISRTQGLALMQAAGFEDCKVAFPMNDGFTQLVFHGIRDKQI